MALLELDQPRAAKGAIEAFGWSSSTAPLNR